MMKMNSPLAVLLLLFFVVPFIAVPIGAVCGLLRYIRNRRRPPLVAWLPLAIGLRVLLLYTVLSLLASRANLHLYLLGMGLYSWQFILQIFIVSCLLFGGLFLAVKRVASWRTLFYALLLCVSLFVFVVVGAFFRYDVCYTEVSSPVEAGAVHELVFEEKSWLLAGYGTVYERVSPCFMRRLDDYDTDDGGRPVAQDACTFEWREDGFIMKYFYTADIAYSSEAD